MPTSSSVPSASPNRRQAVLDRGRDKRIVAVLRLGMAAARPQPPPLAAVPWRAAAGARPTSGPSPGQTAARAGRYNAVSARPPPTRYLAPPGTVRVPAVRGG